MGFELEYRHGSDAFYYDDPESGREQWQPLSDDVQALRVAVELQLSILWFTNLQYVMVERRGFGENIGWIHLAGIAVDAEDYGARTFYTFPRGTVLCIR